MMPSPRVFAPLVLGFAFTGCMTQFQAGPAFKSAPKQAQVVITRCDTRADLFDCKTAPAVQLFVGDYLAFNGVAAGGKNELAIHITEDRNVVALKLNLRTTAGLAWSAEAQGDTMMRALVRLEMVLAETASYGERYVTHEDLRSRMEKAKRKHLAADKNTFEYR